jgi:hypothetical protein
MADQVIDAETLPKIWMPNQDGFVPDPRPDVDEPGGGAHLMRSPFVERQRANAGWWPGARPATTPPTGPG